MRLAFLITLALATSSTVAKAQNIADFNGPLAKVTVADKKYWLRLSDKDDIFLVSAASPGGPNITLETARLVAETFVQPLGCGIPTVYEHAGPYTLMLRYATFLCPAGVDLRAQMEAHKKEIKKGDPLTAN
ncbi:hypothetical protein AEAC466_17265 [Asticcacaulis sp. AC466]|uniref:hypothetical protein n=1 Tax=Asticcacaulis sp. AC466 TaxID=1282362 RepID=UPI0003C3D12B|nr:hypothetical protein [Asticcacaulis sp. AC466]ESQ82372.1 hypothetical protein AEAC466_17265 [Asticcacaulis sp. AC466]